jgi:hypothetical protein
MKNPVTKSLMKYGIFATAMLITTSGAAGFAQDSARSETALSPSRRAVIYVMPNALAGPASNGSQIIAESGHNGPEPQVAKIYHELQQSKSCQGFAENMIKENADYFLLLQHGGGKGNRWAASDKAGNVIASGESFKLGTSVNDACVAIEKDWRQRTQAASGAGAGQTTSR